MQKKLLFNARRPQAEPADELLKTTSLLYFEEALINEAYEDCPELISRAKVYGAGLGDIRKVIAQSVRKVQSGGRTTVPVKGGARRRF